MEDRLQLFVFFNADIRIEEIRSEKEGYTRLEMASTHPVVSEAMLIHHEGNGDAVVLKRYCRE
jgi:hypothetical protein